MNFNVYFYITLKVWILKQIPYLVGTFAIAWVMTKFTEPLRLGFTVATVPTIARWLGHRREKHDDDDDDDDDDNDDKKHNKKKFSKKD